MSNKAIRGVMSPAKLPLGTENELNFHLLICYCYFGETAWLEKPGVLPSFSPHILPFYFFPVCFLRVSFSEEPGYLTPTVSGECLSPTGSSESPHPQKREDASLRWAGSPSRSLQHAPQPRSRALARWGEGAPEQLWGCWTKVAAGHLCAPPRPWQ